jgi:hypothetical protein
LSRPLLGAGLIAFIVNLIVIGGFVWGRDGQTTVVTVEGVDGRYRAFVDGRRSVPGEGWTGGEAVPLAAPASGTVVVTLPAAVPSLPSPSGLDAIVVLDPTGVRLFEDEFETLDATAWDVTAGAVRVEDGVLVTMGDGHATIVLKDRAWRDYTVAATFRNGVSGVIGSHADGSGAVFYHFNLIRDFPNFLDANLGGERTGRAFGGFIHTEKDETLASIAAMTTAFYPFLLAAVLAGGLLTLLLVRTDSAVRRALDALAAWGLGRFSSVEVAAVLIVIGAGAAALAIGWHYYAFLPHVPDEVSYLFQARLLAEGQVTAAIPPVKEAFYFYSPSFLYEHGERWASFYPFGHPLLLAVGARIGAVWLVPALVGAASVGLTYLVGRRLYGAWTGLVAAGLLAASPFFLMQASGFMSHNTAAFYVLLSLLFVLKRERPLLWGLVAGLAFGLGVNTRPLTMIALVLPFGVLLLSYLLPRDGRSDAVRHTVAFGLGALAMGAAFLAYNYGITGDPLTTPYAGQDGDNSTLFGFTNGHTLDVGLRNQQAQLMALLLALHGWPAAVGLAFVLLPFLTGTRNRWDYFLLLAAASPIGIYVFYRYSGVYEGPRYWYEAVPFLILLAARGAECAAGLLNSLAGDGRLLLSGYHRPPPRRVGGVVVYAAVAALVVYGSGGWILGWQPAWNTPLVPGDVRGLDGIFGVDNRLDRLADETELENALVLVKPCGFFASPVCYGSVFLRNPTTFDGAVVWARYLPERNAEIIAAFPGRTVYVATWDGGASIEPYDPSQGP